MNDRTDKHVLAQPKINLQSLNPSLGAPVFVYKVNWRETRAVVLVKLAGAVPVHII